MMSLLLHALLALYALAALAASGLALAEFHPRPRKPHVVVFVIDDLGWTDVGYREGSGVHTPTLDRLLTREGVVVPEYYMQPVCSPSRAALMQGRFPYKTGMQHYSTLMPTTYARMPKEDPTLAELLRDAGGYETRAIGKWHLGYAHWSYTPTGRGFSSHKGYLQGAENYYTHEFEVPKEFLPFPTIKGLDWWANQTAVWGDQGQYSKYLFDGAMELELDQYNPKSGKPLFMYYAHQCVHEPVMVPFEWTSNCQHIPAGKRRTYCGMLAAVDDSLRRLEAKLQAKGMWDDTILVITSDNGGMPNAPHIFPGSAGVNFPLRAGKGTLFQGGVKVVGGITGGKNVFPQEARGTQANSSLVHIVDWFPTLVNMGVPPSKNGTSAVPKNVDGHDLWDALVNKKPLTRTALPLNLNFDIQYPDKGVQSGVLADGWKLIIDNSTGPVFHYDGWFPPPPAKDIPAPPNPTPGHFLFNLNEDPYEHNNLYQHEPAMVAKLTALLNEYRKDYVPSQPNDFHVEGIPELHEGTWRPFL